MKFTHQGLQWDISNLKDMDIECIQKDFVISLDLPYTIEVNDISYFYSNEKERDADFRNLIKI